MRRAAPSAPISAQQLKHFAIVAVVITALLALFASGEDWGAQAQVQAAQAKNRLADAEAEKLGTKKLRSHMKVRSNAPQAMAGDRMIDIQPDSGGGGGYSPPAPRVSQPTIFEGPPPSLSSAPGSTVTVTGQTSEQIPGSPNKRKPRKRKGKVTAEENRAIKEAAAQRMGRATAGDD